jgi:hypothetical protein
LYVCLFCFGLRPVSLCNQCCQCLTIVHSLLPLRFPLSFLLICFGWCTPCGSRQCNTRNTNKINGIYKQNSVGTFDGHWPFFSILNNVFFFLFFFVLCSLCCQFLWIVHCDPSVFSNVY